MVVACDNEQHAVAVQHRIERHGRSECGVSRAESRDSVLAERRRKHHRFRAADRTRLAERGRGARYRPDGSNAVTPSTAQSNGTFGRFNLMTIGGIDVLVIVNDYNGPTYVYRLPDGGV